MISGPKTDFERIRKGTGEYFFEQAKKYPDNIFQIYGETGEKETFSSVNKRSCRLAMNMKRLGLTPDHIVITCLQNNLDTVIPHIAALYCGAIFAALDAIQTEKEWIHCLTTVQPKLIFVDEEQSEKMERCIDCLDVKPIMIIAGKSEVHQTLTDLLAPLEEEDDFYPEIIKDCFSTAVICFSSGTTGPPKGVCYSHFGLINALISYLQMNFCDPRVVLVYSTFYWVTSILSLVRAFMSGGCRIMPKRFHPEEALRMIDELKVTHCLLTPKAGNELLKVKDFEKYNTSSLHHYHSAGATIAPDTLVKLRQLFKHSPVSSTLGISELGAVAGFDLTRDFHLLHKLKSVGRCLNNVDVKIIDEETRLELGPNQEGEIWARTPFSATGYYNKESSSFFDSEGFIKTGDTGYYDEDECLYIVGRCNEIFKNGVLKVVPSQWEAVLQEHPAIEEVAVFGLPQENGYFFPAACIVLKSGETVTAEDIEKFFMDKMTSRHRFEGGIKFFQTLPKTPSGKVKRKELVGIFLSA